MVRASTVPGVSRRQGAHFHSPYAGGEQAGESSGERSGDRRGSRLRMVALASAVVLAVVLPFAVATAGPAGPADPGGAPQGHGTPRGLLPAAFPGGATGRGEVPQPSAGPDAAAPSASEAAPGPSGDRAECGPELTSPEGVEAQTCVLGQGHDTWGRTYYRNATGSPLTGVLTLMAPDGRTVQVRCQMAASDDPDVCETPHAATVRRPGGYTAVSEIASTQGKLLLRSGSNSPEGEEG